LAGFDDWLIETFDIGADCDFCFGAGAVVIVDGTCAGLFPFPALFCTPAGTLIGLIETS